MIDRYRQTILQNMVGHDPTKMSNQTCARVKPISVSFNDHVVYVEPCHSHESRLRLFFCSLRASVSPTSGNCVRALCLRTNPICANRPISDRVEHSFERRCVRRCHRHPESKHMSNICQKYVKHMSNICQTYVKHMSNICQRYVKRMSNIC